jgi:hypothetical protein
MECRCEAERAGADGPAPARGVRVERKQGCRACRGRERRRSAAGRQRQGGCPRSGRRASLAQAALNTLRPHGTPRLSLAEWFGRAELRWREEAKWWAEARAACGAAIRVGRCRPAGVPSGRRLSCSQAIGCLAAACAVPVAQRRRREGAQAGGNSTSPGVPRACALLPCPQQILLMVLADAMPCRCAPTPQAERRAPPCRAAAFAAMPCRGVGM